MSENCLFCKIIEGLIPSKKVFENEKVFAFKDISPMAKEHILFVHKKHSKNVVDLFLNDSSQIIDIYSAISEYVKRENILESGFRIVVNTGKNAGQTVFHTHFHLLFGEDLGTFGA